MPTTRHPVSLPKLVTGHQPVVVDLRTLTRHEPGWRQTLIVRGILVVAGVLLLQPILLVAGLILLVPVARRYAKVVRLMRDGDPLPAKLVSVSPPMVAAFGDLSRGMTGSHPVLIVFEVSADSLNRPIQRGDRLAVMAQGVAGDQERFAGLEVRLVSTVTDNPDVLQRSLDSVPDWDWESLDEVLFDLTRNPEPGVYALN